MRNISKPVGLSLALAAASLFGTAPTIANAAGAADNAQVQCYGVNKCAGHNDCKTATNACKGHASCKGHGFVTMSKHACDNVGGSTKADK